jgi:hypothetical protein
MAITITTVDALDAQIAAAIADGTWRAVTVSFGDQTVQLLSLDQAIKLRGDLVRLSAGTTSRTRYASSSKGV